MICRRIYEDSNKNRTIVYYGSYGINDDGVGAEVGSVLNVGDIPLAGVQYFLRVPCSLKRGYLLDGTYRYIPTTVLIDESGRSKKTYYSLSNEGSTGSTKFFNALDKHDNFAKDFDGTYDSLIQHLSIMKGELWFSANYGLPLLEKVKNKLIIDASLGMIITSIESVESLQSIVSKIFEHKYTADVRIKTIYGEMNVSI